MKRLVFLIVLFNFYSFYGQQQTISGQIFDKYSQKPLAFADIYINDNTGTVSDFDGKFFIKISSKVKQIKVSYIGYKTNYINITKKQDFYKIYLIPVKEKLNEVVLQVKTRNPAVTLIKKVIKHKKENDYRKRLKKFSFTQYFKLLISVNRDKLNCSVDTIINPRETNNPATIDSTMYKFCNEFKDKELYMLENITKINGKNGRFYKKVIALRTAGLKNPFYELLQIQLMDQNVYDDYYKFLFNDYLSPLSNLSFKQYKYKINDTLSIQNRQVYKVSFLHTTEPIMAGDIYIDANNSGIAKMTLNTYKKVQLKTVYNFKYIVSKNLWFPVNVNTHIKKAEQTESINLFKGSISVKYKHTKKDSLHHTNKQTVEDVIYLQSTKKISDILLDNNYSEKIKYDLEIDPLANKQTEQIWSKYRNITVKEINTYKYIDSVFKKEKIEDKLHKYKTVFRGYYPLSFLDWNYLKLFNYNKYEGIRLQIGLKTNNKISGNFFIDAYTAYGFKDKSFKYAGGIHYKLHHKTQSFISINYKNDLEKSASFNNITSSNIGNLNHIAYEKYVAVKKVDFDFKTLVLPTMKLNINFYKTDNKQTFNTSFHPGRIEFKDYDIVGLKTNISWAPQSKYMLTDKGRKSIKNAYPKFMLNYETNFSSLQTDKSKFNKIQLQSIFRKIYPNKDFTDLFINIGMIIGTPHISQLFQPDFNSFNTNISLNYNLAGIYRFETVKDFEFLSDFIITGHLSHRINNIHLWKNKKIDIRLTSAYALGYSFDFNKYTGINQLDKGLLESGIEFHKLLWNLGLGIYYRYGAYKNKKNLNNIALRLIIDETDFMKMFQ